MPEITIDGSITEMVNRLMDLEVSKTDNETLEKQLKVAETICALSEISIKQREQQNKESELHLANKKLNIEALRLADQMNVCVPEKTILEIAYDGRK